MILGPIKMALLAITHGQSPWQWGRDIDSGYSQALGCGSGVKCCIHWFTRWNNWNPVADAVVEGWGTFRRRDLDGGSGWSSCFSFLRCFLVLAMYCTSTIPELEDRVLVLAFCGAPCCNGDCRPPWWSVLQLMVKRKVSPPSFKSLCQVPGQGNKKRSQCTSQGTFRKESGAQTWLRGDLVSTD